MQSCDSGMLESTTSLLQLQGGEQRAVDSQLQLQGVCHLRGLDRLQLVWRVDGIAFWRHLQCRGSLPLQMVLFGTLSRSHPACNSALICSASVLAVSTPRSGHKAGTWRVPLAVGCATYHSMLAHFLRPDVLWQLCPAAHARQRRKGAT